MLPRRMLARFAVVHIESSTSLQECLGAHPLTRNMLRSKRGSKHSTEHNICETRLELQLYKQGRLPQKCSGTLMNRRAITINQSINQCI